MHNLDPTSLIFAGFGGGLAGSIAGLASLVSYRALLAVGLPPVTANVTNTVALVFSSAGSVWGSSPELRDRRRHHRRTAPARHALTVLHPRRPGADRACRARGLDPTKPSSTTVTSPHAPGWVLTVWVFVIGIYGGYFGAAAGVLMLSVLMFCTGESIARSNAMKNLLLGGANGIAAIAFILFRRCDGLTPSRSPSGSSSERGSAR